MLRSIEDSTSFIIRYLWTGFVGALVVGGLVVAIGRANAEQRQEIDKTHSIRLAEHPVPSVLVRLE